MIIISFCRISVYILRNFLLRYFGQKCR